MPENILIWSWETEIQKQGLNYGKESRNKQIGIVAADYWKSYNQIVPETMLLHTKAETYTVESYNEQIRHFLARFRRKTKCYSKYKKMMELSLKLLIAKRNNLISMQIY